MDKNHAAKDNPILLVGNDPNECTKIQDILKTFGYEEFWLAGKGIDGIEKAILEKPKVVLICSDVEEPGWAEVSQKIREKNGTMEMKIVLIEAEPELSLAHKAREVGVDEVIEKTDHYFEVLDIVNYLIREL